MGSGKQVGKEDHNIGRIQGAATKQGGSNSNPTV